jgi:hypothetical protein
MNIETNTNSPIVHGIAATYRRYQLLADGALC